MQLGLHGPEAPQLTTSDLLRLLAADGAPFADVAAAVVHRFGGDANSSVWLARTLVTLLRDGLLYTEAEKMNAAYLLRFAAPDVPGAREALLHLALPGSGEPPAVRAWAASLAAAATPAQHPGAALLHQRSPRQVLADAAAPLDAQVPFCGLEELGAPPPPLPWQLGGLEAAAAAPEPDSPHQQPPILAQQQQQAQQRQQGKQQQQQQQQQQQMELEVEASLAALAASREQQQQQQAPPPPPPPSLQQQAEDLQALQTLLWQAAAAPQVPATQQRLVAALRSEAAAALLEPLAEALDGSSASSAALQPHDMQGLVERNAHVAAELLVALAERHPEAGALFAAAVAELPMSAQSVEAISALVARAEVPDWVLTTFLAGCMRDTSACQDAGRQSRQVRLLCACCGLVLRHQPGALEESLPELLAFCIQQSKYKQASELYRQLKDMQ